MRGFRTWIVAALLALPCAAHAGGASLSLIAPLEGQLSSVGPVAVELLLPPPAKKAVLELRVDGNTVPLGGFELRGRTLRGVLEGLGAGRHRLTLEAHVKHGSSSLASWFELVELENPEQCEVLNNAACLLPFPSSRFLEPAATRTGYRVVYGPDALPVYNRLEVPLVIPPVVLETKHADPTPFLQNDGFSPTVQVLMSFPQGVDPLASDASRLDPVTRTYGTRGLDADSPTLLIELGRGKRINHWIENDSRTQNRARTVTFLRPGEALLPGHRYAVAVRRLVDATGAPVASTSLRTATA